MSKKHISIKQALDKQIYDYKRSHNGFPPIKIEMTKDEHLALLAEDPKIGYGFYRGSKIVVIGSGAWKEFEKARSEYIKRTKREPERIQMTKETFEQIKFDLAMKYGIGVPVEILKFNGNGDAFLFGVKVEVIDGR